MVNTSPCDEGAAANVVHGIRVRAPRAVLWLEHSARSWTHEFELRFEPAEAGEMLGQLPGESLAHQRWGETTEYSFTQDKHTIRFAFPEFCSGTVDLANGLITMRAQSAADAGLVFPNTVLSAVLGPAPDVVLHASAVSNAGQTIALCGTSGAGKSSLATALSLAGYSIVSDDALRLRIDARGAVTCYPGMPELRLRQTRSWLLPKERLRPLADDRVGYLPLAREDTETRLRALVFPIVSPTTSAPSMQRLRGEGGLRQLLCASRIAWTGSSNARAFKQLALLHRSAPLYVLNLPSTFLDSTHHPDELGVMLERELEGLWF